MNTKQQELIAEVQRLASESPSGNCTRDYFRRNSDFSEHLVKREFGNFSALFIAAGLKEGRLSNRAFNRQGQLATQEIFAEYMDKHVRPWSREGVQRDTDHAVLVVGSDFHGEGVDTFALEVFLDTIRSIQPDHVVLNGDILDFEPVGRYAKNPNVVHSLQAEIDFTIENILAPVREAVPEAEIDFVIGNHEYRLMRYLSEQAPGLASLRCLGFGELFNLSELDMNLILGGDMLAVTDSEQRREVSKAYKVFYDTFVVTHGTATGPSAANNELNRFKMSGCSGHLHRHSYASASSLDRPYMEWNIMPKMCRDDVAEVYGKGLPLGWHTGFAVVDIFPETKTSFFNPVHVRNGVAINGGTVYRDSA